MLQFPMHMNIKKIEHQKPYKRQTEDKKHGHLHILIDKVRIAYMVSPRRMKLTYAQQ